MGRKDGQVALTLYTPLTIKTYNHSYKKNLPARLLLNRLSRLKEINPAIYGKNTIFFSVEKQCHLVPKYIEGSSIRNH